MSMCIRRWALGDQRRRPAPSLLYRWMAGKLPWPALRAAQLDHAITCRALSLPQRHLYSREAACLPLLLPISALMIQARSRAHPLFDKSWPGTTRSCVRYLKLAGERIPSSTMGAFAVLAQVVNVSSSQASALPLRPHLWSPPTFMVELSQARRRAHSLFDFNFTGGTSKAKLSQARRRGHSLFD